MAFPDHDPDAEDGTFDGIFDDEDLAGGCQCRSCQAERGTLTEVPEPIVYEIFY